MRSLISLHKLDLNRIAAVGHSMGGATSARALQVEPEIKSAINIDGTFFGLTDPGRMTKPFAIIATESTELYFNGRAEQPCRQDWTHRRCKK